METVIGGPILVTGAAGFIGYHTARRLLERGRSVIGLDNLNDYYDPKLKDARLAELVKFSDFRFEKLDLADRAGIAALFAANRFSYVVHLAAQAGVRYSLVNPHAYVDANLIGFTNILEGCRHNGCRHLLFASSSSVYGSNTKMPFSVHDNVDHPLSLYGASKKANELMAHAYAHLFGLPTTGLRFFTVYGPWGRPDMAMWIFASAIIDGKPIKLFNHGKMRRDFTFVDDVVEVGSAVGGSRAVWKSKMVERNARSRNEFGTMADLQYRQQQSSRAAGSRAFARGKNRQKGKAKVTADAAGRRPGDIRER